MARSVPAHASLWQNYPIRFLLTFDDGPSAAAGDPTGSVLNQLMQNRVQSNIKAMFFVQTRSARNGGREFSRRVLQREHAENHVLALHSGSIRGHLNHTTMKPADLQQSLEDGMEDIADIVGTPPLFVRPPFWRYNADTLSQYENNGLHMILSDIKAYDGGSGALHFRSMFRSQRRGSMQSELQRVQAGIDRGELPVVNGVIPVIVTFHDTNTHTAKHLEEYLQILVEEAKRTGLMLGDKPFYDDPGEIQAAAVVRAERRVIFETRLPARLSRFLKRS